MRIEFHFTDCSKLLRGVGGLGGKRSKCPSCNSLQTVPIQNVVQQAIKVPSAKNYPRTFVQPPKPSAVDESPQTVVPKALRPPSTAAPKLFNLLKPTSDAQTAIPAAAKRETSYAVRVNPIIAVVPPTASPSMEAVWDQIEVPTPDWTAANTSDRNPHAPPLAYGSNSTRSYERSLTVANYLRKVQERIWPILRWSLIPTMMMIGIVGGIGGLVMIDYEEAEPFVRSVSGVIGLCVGNITPPAQLLPLTLADGFPVGHAIQVAFRYVFGHFWRFVGLSILASLIFWAPGVLIFANVAIAFAITGAGAGSAIGAIVFTLAMVSAGPVAVFFYPGFYDCYASFNVLAKENDR